MISNSVGKLCNKAGTYKKVNTDGNVVINRDDIVLDSMKIKGDL